MPLVARRERRVLVVLGERGVGKSDVLRSEHEDLVSAGAASRFLDLSTVSSQRAAQRVGDALRAPDDGVHYVHFDGLDDASFAADMANLLGEELEGLDEARRERLRVRLSCRTSRWPASLDSRLRGLWGDGLQLVHVAGLTREQAVLAARSRGLADAQRFIEYLESRRLVVPVAMWPVTFVPTLEDAAAGRPLPRNARDAYERACLQLCTETASEPSLTGNIRLDPGELVALARKAAAVLQFSARSAVCESLHDQDAVSLHDLAQGAEPLGEDRVVSCTYVGFRQLMQTGLLVPSRQDGHWAFAHRSFQEYLAAQYLYVHGTAAANRRTLLVTGHSPAVRAIAAHRDVAAWVAMFDDELFECLLANDPGVLLLADLQLRGEADRGRVFDALMDMVRDGDGDLLDYTLFARLDSPSIVGRLQPLLRETTPRDDLYVAVLISIACPHIELTDPLLAIAEAADLPKSLRTRALRALLHEFDQPTWLVRLRTLAGDADPDVAASALRQLWPRHLGTSEVLDLLPAPMADYIGMASSFLSTLPEAIPESDLLDAVRWAVRVFAEDAPPRAGGWRPQVDAAAGVVTRGMKACPTHPDPQALIDALADAVLAFVGGPRAHESRGAAIDIQQVLNESSTTRRAIARAVLGRATAEQVLLLYSANPLCLFYVPDDTAYWARSLPGLPPRLQDLFDDRLWFVPHDPEEWAEVWQLAQSEPIVKKLTRGWYSWPADHWAGQEFRRRREYEARQQAEQAALRYDEAALEDAVATTLTDNADPRAAWRTVLCLVNRTPDGKRTQFTERLDMTSAPSFPPEGSPLREQIERSAHTALVSAPTIAVDTVGPTGLRLLGHVPELCALAMCATAGRQMPMLHPTRWTGLAVALFCVQGSDLDLPLRDLLLAHSAEQAAGGFGQALPDLLTRLSDPWRDRSLATLRNPLGADARGALLDWARDRRRSVEQWTSTMRTLTKWEDTQAFNALDKILKTPASRLRDAASTPTRRWIAAAEIIIRHGRTDAWSTVFRRLGQAPHLIPALLRALAADNSPEPWHCDPQSLPAKELARLYDLLLEHGAGDEILAEASFHYNINSNILRLRQSLPHLIANKADGDSLTVLRDMAQRRPTDRAARQMARNLEHRLIQQAWRAFTSTREVVTAATHRTERVVTSEVHLRDAVIESLARLQDRIQDDNGWASALWNLTYTRTNIGGKQRRETHWTPKWENDLSDFVATFLRYDLADRSVVVNREVEITRPGLPGDRTDIQVHAHTPGEPGHEPLTVIIESKGCWNTKLTSELSDQLVDRYLRRPGRRAGIYLIGYFDDERWQRTDRRHADHEIEDILAQQQDLADRAAHDHGVSVAVVVLDCRLRGQHTRVEPDQ